MPFQLECPIGHGHNEGPKRDILRQLRDEGLRRLDHIWGDRRRTVAIPVRSKGAEQLDGGLNVSNEAWLKISDN